MSIQRDLIPRLVARVVDASPASAVLLIGSVADGAERPDSDIDLIVVTPSHEVPAIGGTALRHREEGLTLLEASLHGVAAWRGGALRVSSDARLGANT